MLPGTIPLNVVSEAQGSDEVYRAGDVGHVGRGVDSKRCICSGANSAPLRAVRSGLLSQGVTLRPRILVDIGCNLAPMGGAEGAMVRAV